MLQDLQIGVLKELKIALRARAKKTKNDNLYYAESVLNNALEAKKKTHDNPRLYIDTAGDRSVGISSGRIVILDLYAGRDPEERKYLKADAINFANRITDNGKITIRFEDECEFCGKIMEKERCKDPKCYANSHP